MSSLPPESEPRRDEPGAHAEAPPARVHRSRWRLLTSADGPGGARAAARSLLASLLVREEVDLGVAPWFRGGFCVEFVLTHVGSRGQALAELRRMMTRACAEHDLIEEAGQPVFFWSGSLVIPRAETLEVRLVETAD